LASVYTISDGTGRISISDAKDTYVICQLVATSLDADVTVKLQHSSDGVNFFDITDSKTLSFASDSDTLESYNFTLDTCYLYVNVGSATTGSIDVYRSSKKKKIVQ